ncbi:Ankyrin repeat-containing protein family [Quillaja saponaria]|uniref:Ankyrin repeat-containing protein family n=1 Tax=Quillaja saponaria TaxID=32244 RepID=A0AAD7L4G9_QUISA|nr:Ankyrin repeat-containing protein family [Quillaja saponaria]
MAEYRTQLDNLEEAKKMIKKLKAQQLLSCETVVVEQQQERHQPTTNFDYKFSRAIENDNIHDFVDELEQVVKCSGNNLSVCNILEQVTPAGNSCLHVAARYRSVNLAILIAYECPSLLIKTNIVGDTPLHVAAKTKIDNGKPNIVEFILKSYKEAVDPDVKPFLVKVNKCGNTPLHEAVLHRHQSNNHEVAAILFEENKGVAYVPNKERKSPLYLAAENWDADLNPQENKLKLILNNGPAELMLLRDDDGNTPLHFAAITCDVKAVSMLLDKCHQCVLETNKKGQLPIHVASENNCADVVNCMLDRQEALDPKDLLNTEGQNIFHVSAKNGKDKVVTYILGKQKLDALLNDQDINGNTPLHLAAENLHVDVLRSLTNDDKIKVKLTNNKGMTARDVAILVKTPSTLRKSISVSLLRYAGTPSPVTFAAGFTVPGSVNSSDHKDPGLATLVNRRAFQVFIICNTVAMFSSTVGSFILLWAQFGGDYNSAKNAFTAGLYFTFVALFTMYVAFVAAVCLVVRNLFWLVHEVLVIGTFFLSIFLLAYLSYIYHPYYGTRTPFMHIMSDILMWILLPFLKSEIPEKDQGLTEDMGVQAITIEG